MAVQEYVTRREFYTQLSAIEQRVDAKMESENSQLAVAIEGLTAVVTALKAEVTALRDDFSTLRQDMSEQIKGLTADFSGLHEVVIQSLSPPG